MIKINHQINEEGINNPVFFRNSNLFKLSSVDSGAINLSIARPLKLCPQRQKKKTKTTRATEFVTDWSIFSATNLSARIRLNFAAT